MSTVKVKANPETKQVINAGKNPEYGTFRVESETVSMENGFINRTKRSAFIRGKMEDLKALNLHEGKELKGKIIVKESTTPFYEGQSPKINPSTGEVLSHGGSPIYRESTFTSDLSAEDTMLQNDKAEVSATIASSL